MESLGARSTIAPALVRAPTKSGKHAKNVNPFRVRAAAKDDDTAEKTKSAVSGA
jgi:hypothetical protein